MPATVGNRNYWKLRAKLLDPRWPEFGSSSQIGDSCFTVARVVISRLADKSLLKAAQWLASSSSRDELRFWRRTFLVTVGYGVLTGEHPTKEQQIRAAEGRD
jgi:hypothetical protein